MSVLIKGMKMPKSCSTCQMLEGDPADGICHAAGRWLDDDEYWTWYVYPEGDIDDSRPSNCPLVELPDHGDLIDRDALAELLGVADSCADCQYQEGIFCEKNWAEVCGAIYDDAKVIIPSERSEECEKI